MRWLLLKDLQILRRSPLLVGLLVIYPVLIALLIGYALSRGPTKPKVAFLNEVPAGQGSFNLGGHEDQRPPVRGQVLQPPSTRSSSTAGPRRCRRCARGRRWPR